MLCPIDGSELSIIDRQGVQIDLCPRCGGVWLDRGELDKIIDAAYALPAAPPGQDPPSVGVWADTIQPSAPPPTPQQVQQQAPQQMNQATSASQMLSDLLSGIASAPGAPAGRQAGRRKKPRGWLEEIFDIDLS